MKNILITGGSGSFGNACVKHLLANDHFGKIIIYSRDEHKQEAMREKFNNDGRLRFFIGDVRDKDRLFLALNTVDTVIHAAALKIVPLAESNPMEYVKTNVFGTQNLIDCCLLHAGAIEKIIMLSTDKAVHPLNLYGATKLCAEKLVLASNNIHGPRHSPKFSVVRYGNVCNSNGSVIPLFAKCVKEGKLLPVTDSYMTRFWLELEEAVEFTLNSLAKAKGGEVFVPNMPSMRIMDLVEAFGHRHTYIGIRPGEKLHEQILTDSESELEIYKNIPKNSGTNNTFLTVNHIRDRLKAWGMLNDQEGILQFKWYDADLADYKIDVED